MRPIHAGATLTPHEFSSRIKTLFSEAVELPAGSVDGFLDCRCDAGDPDRALVESLLRAHGRAGRFLDPVSDSTVLPPDRHFSTRIPWLGLGEKPGSVIDRYEIVEVLGEGGFGVVYRARQIRPVRRAVALKVIKPGSKSDAVLARFEVERQALAAMEHPNIAGLIDAATTETGQPYFVMELVDGPPITVHVRSARLSASDVLALYIPVCQAVHHAHQKGILHRDIKPSNILVDAVSGTAKVIDFGIAKPIWGDGAGELTEIGQRIGTPKYMSPEQAVGHGAMLDTRSDVYSLGAVLTEMLTAAGDEVVSIKALPRELRWVLQKATDPEPDRRYGSAAALGDDLQHYLDGRPLEAGPAGLMYLARKFFGRHKVGTALATAAVLVLVASLVALSVALVRVKASRDQILSSEHARQSAEKQAIDKLWDSLLVQGRSGRRMGVPGQRFDSLRAISDAVRIRPSPELRDEMIACLATPDMWLQQVWAGDPGWKIAVFTTTRDRFAEFNSAGDFQIVRAADRKVVCHIPRLSDERPRDLIFNHDGTYLIANYYGDPKIGLAVWDTGTGRCVMRASGPKRVRSIGGDDRSIVYADEHGNLVFYDLITGKTGGTIPTGGQVDLISCQTGTNLIAVYGSSTGLNVFDRTGTARPRRLPTPPESIASLSWSPDGRRFAFGTVETHSIEIIDVPTAKVQRTLQGHLSAVMQLCFADHGRLLVSTSWDTTVRVWDVGTGGMLLTAKGSGYIQNLDGDDSIYLIAKSNELEQWHLLPGSACVPLNCLLEDIFVEAVTFSPDSRLIVATTNNGLCVWSTESGLMVGYLPIATARTPIFVNGGTRLLVSTAGGVREFPVSALTCGDGPRGPVADRGLTAGMAVNRDRSMVVTSDSKGVLWSARVDNLAAKVEIGHASEVPRFVAVSADGCWALTACRNDQYAEVWDLANRTRRAILPINSEAGETGGVGICPDGKVAVTADFTTYYFWRVPEWTLDHKLERDRGTDPGLLAFSHDGKLLAVTGAKQELELRDPHTGDRLATLEMPCPHGSTQLAFSDDDSKLSLGTVGGVIVWDLRQIRSELNAAGLNW